MLTIETLKAGVKLTCPGDLNLWTELQKHLISLGFTHNNGATVPLVRGADTKSFFGVYCRISGTSFDYRNVTELPYARYTAWPETEITIDQILQTKPARKRMSLNEIEHVLGYKIDLVTNKALPPENVTYRSLSREAREEVDELLSDYYSDEISASSLFDAVVILVNEVMTGTRITTNRPDKKKK